MGSQLLLRWDNHLPSFACSMKECFDDGDLTDLTISCQGRVLRCHKLVLSVASPHFKQLLKTSPDKHPIVIMRDIPYKDMAALLTFIYQGEVTVSEEELPSFLKTAKALEVRGLTDDERAKAAGGSAPPPQSASATNRAPSGRPSHLEPEVVVKEEPCDPDETPPVRPPVAMTAISDMSMLKTSTSQGFRFEGGNSFQMAPAASAPKTVSPCVVRLEKLDGEGGGGGAVSHIVGEPSAAGDPAAGNLDDMLIPGTSALLDRILRRQLSLPERGYFCPYCTREVNMRTLGKHMTKIHGGMRLQCKGCREVVHTRVTSLLINHGICVLLLNKNSKLGDQLIRKLSRQIRSIYKNRRFKSQMLKRYPDLSYFCSSFIFGRVKQPCERCGLVLWSSSMASHLEKCGEDVIQCDFCNKHMARTRLPYHVDIYHPGKVIQQKPLALPPPPADDESGDESPRPLAHPVFSAAAPDEAPSSAQIVSCTKCHKKMRQNNLRRHMRVMHPWKPSMRRVDPATGLARVPSDQPPTLEVAEQPQDQHMMTLSDDEPMEGARQEVVDDEPAEQATADNKYAAYKRTCPVCSKTMWKKYLVSHVRSSHPEYELDEEGERHLNNLPPPPGAVSKAKVIKHCPHCWKTMWRCNVKRHIRQVHPEHSHELTDSFDLEAAIRAAALERGLPPPASEPSSAGEEDGQEDEEDAASMAIREMNAMAEAEGMEALQADDDEPEGEEVLDDDMDEGETVPTNSRRHEKNLKRCRYCSKLLRGCHMRRHILNWHSGSPGKPSTKTGVPGGLNPARQRTCPVCHKTVVVNNLRRHIRASHPEVSEEELQNVTDTSYPGMSAALADEASNDASLADADETSSSGPPAPTSAPATPGGTYANRRMRRCPFCGKVMVSSNMARHCKTHHPVEWRATHGDGSGAARADARSAAEAAEEMEAMNAEETAAWLDETGMDGTDEMLDGADAFEDDEPLSEDGEDPIGVGDDLEEDEPAEHPDVLAAGEEPTEDPLGMGGSPADHPDLLDETDEPADHPDLLEEADEPADHPDLLAEADEPADHPDLLAEADEPADHPDLLAEADEPADHPDLLAEADEPADHPDLLAEAEEQGDEQEAA
ncbi:Longitudinals lacking protein-like [Amphibalanus amphitrite]|uniref:Longitudinals lacking protein-like n=1 Tax=Amphibalanus amphitrite TaxID=1232801 RepID=A0A6A4WFT3_AMPAM|nr:uncharacterized protein LOC122369540 [Amphibalanus amphitrite]KAF0302683.1 Longitudinals lacking protein-like [Amphibalanus amphitrite]KAF0302684.1 Longitudinals lacking protein-like [Amphibalanus amphitrite]